jgi:hypothetical protein
VISNSVPETETWPSEDEGGTQPELDEAAADGEAVSGEAVMQEVDAYPVLAEAVEIEQVRFTSMPAVQAAALAATGFVAGAATVVLVRRHAGRKLARVRLEQAALRELRDAGEPSRRGKGASRRGKRAAEETAATATYLVNVRLLARTED